SDPRCPGEGPADRAVRTGPEVPGPVGPAQRTKRKTDMLNFKSSLTALGAASLLGLSSLVVAAPASAQSLADVLKKVQADSNEMTAENQQRLKEFQQDKNAQAAKMSEAQAALNAAEGRGKALGAEFDANEATLADLEGQVTAQAGDFQELLG